jgi:hypothetical protein
MVDATQAPQKKGLHPLAWVGIGCGVMIVVVVAALVVGGYFVAQKAKSFAQDLEDNPGLTAARFIVKASPELEEVSVDEAAGTMTIRNTKTGELITVNFEDIEAGRFSWSTGDEEVTVDVSDAESGTVKVESSDGEGFKLTTGAAVSGDLPAWVPVYPGTEPTGRGSMQTSETASGNYSSTSDATVAEVSEFFRAQLKTAGFEVSFTTFSGDGNEGAMVNGSHEAEGKTVVVVVNRSDDSTGINVTYSEKL